MAKLSSIEEILDFAINEEEAAATFYDNLGNNTTKVHMKVLFYGLAKEEMGHKKKLLKIKAGTFALKAECAVFDLKITDYVVDTVADSDMEYKEALILAMKKEKAAFRIYSDLADRAGDDRIREILLSLAEEEARHKLRFEIEYEDCVMRGE